MWPNCDCNFFIKLFSAIVLSFAVVVNGFGNLIGVGDLIETTVHSCFATEESTTVTETESTTVFVPTTITTTEKEITTESTTVTTTTTTTTTATTTTTKPTTTTTTKPLTTVTTNSVVTTPDEDTLATLYGSKFNYTFTEIEPVADGGYVACGTKNNGLFTLSFIVKFDKNAGIEWEKDISAGSDFVIFNDLAILGNGNIVVAGYHTIQTDTESRGRADACIYIFSQEDGTQLSFKSFGNKGEDIFSSVSSAENNGFVVCGKSDSTKGDFLADANGSAIIVNFDSECNPVWTKYLKGSKGASAESIATDKYGNIFVAVLTSSTDGDFTQFKNLKGGYVDSVIIKYDKNGNCLWDYAVATSGRDNFTAIAPDGSGGCVVAGYYELINAITTDGTLAGLHNCGGIDAVVISITSAGKTSWTKSVAGFCDDYITDISKSSKGYVVSGYSNSNNRDFSSIGNLGEYDGFACVISTTGKQTAIYSQAGSLDDGALCVAARTNNAKIMVAGRTKSADGNFEANKNDSKYYTGYVAPYTIK